MGDEEQELQLLRHARLRPDFSFQLEGGAYHAYLITSPTALAPAYALEDARGKQLGRCVLPSVLQDVELHLLGWLTCWDSVHGLR